MRTIQRSTRRRIAAMAAASLLLAVGIASAATNAWAADGISFFEASGQIEENGHLSVSTTITFTEDAPSVFVQRLDTTQPAEGYTYYSFDITNITATANGADLAPVVTTDGDFVVITVDTSQIGSAQLTIGYEVDGAAIDGGIAGDGVAITEVSWPLLQGLSQSVTDATGIIRVPGVIRGVDCQSGALSGLEPCRMWGGAIYTDPDPYFEDALLAPGHVVILSFIIPSETVAVNQTILEHWSLDRAFSISLVPLLAALGALVLGGLGLFALYRARGRDVTSSKEPTRVASFTPSGKGTVTFEVHDEIRPGHVGTVIDEHVDPIDITATLLDLAARGHMRIIQLPSEGLNRPIDWTFKRLECDEALNEFESTLLDAVAPRDGEAPLVSEIDKPIEQVISEVQGELYEDVVQRGWFAHRPNETRQMFATIGWTVLGAAVIALILLVAMTKFGLLGLVLVVLAAGLLTLAQTMPRRTGEGVDLLHGLNALSMVLQTQPTDQVPKEAAYDEISRVLPYAVVLGGQERWVQALADADDDPGVPDPEDLNWYHAPADWHLQDLPVCLDAFITTVSGQLISRD